MLIPILVWGGISDTVEVADFGSYEQLITEVRRIWHLSETLQLRFFYKRYGVLQPFGEATFMNAMRSNSTIICMFMYPRTEHLTVGCDILHSIHKRLCHLEDTVARRCA